MCGTALAFEEVAESMRSCSGSTLNQPREASQTEEVRQKTWLS